jgi:rod shape-determining protein MreC
MVKLNRGSDDGIRPDMPVITGDGLIGRTEEVSRHTCDVLLVTDPGSRVACRLSRTGAFGVVRGTGALFDARKKLQVVRAVEPCRMDYIPKDRSLFRGDEVVTSGLGGVFPEGLLVGHVADVALDSSGVCQTATVVPAARLGTLRYAFVVSEPAGRTTMETEYSER